MAVGQLDAMEPPKVAVEGPRAHPQAVGQARRATRAVLAQAPFSTGRVDDVMAATDRDDAMLEIYRLLR